jgi:hypothetical protein
MRRERRKSKVLTGVGVERADIVIVVRHDVVYGDTGSCQSNVLLVEYIRIAACGAGNYSIVVQIFMRGMNVVVAV